MIMLILFFWLAFFLLLCTWILYPVFLIFIKVSRDVRGPLQDGEYKPKVCFIIAAYNEEKYIAARIDNILRLNYPRHLLQIIVVSDGSTDRTCAVVEEFSRNNKEVTLLSFADRRGRAFAHNESVKEASTGIVIFTDARTECDRGFLKNLLPHFRDSSVGCVTGRVHYKNTGQSSLIRSAGLYWEYEDLMRRRESDIGLFCFGTGAALAVRKELYSPLGLDEDIDRVVPLEVKMKGYNVIYEPRAKVYDYFESSHRQAYRARVRKTSRAFRDILPRLLRINPLKNPVLFASVFLHKTSRHLSPLYMLGMLVVNLLLVSDGIIYKTFLLMQILFYTFAFIGYMLEKAHRNILLFSLPYNFVLLNFGRFVGVLRSSFGARTITYN